MTRRFAIPEQVLLGGVLWSIERAWPPKAAGARVPLEARSGRRVRGGWWSEEPGVTLPEPQDDARLPALAGLLEQGELVSHRPGKRAVVRLSDGAGFAKAVVRGRAPRVVAAHELGAAFGRGYRVPQLLEHPLRSADAAVFSPLAGRTLAALGDDPAVDLQDWRAAWQAWSRAWAGVVATPAAALPTHDAHDEARVLHEWAGHAAVFEHDGPTGDRLRAAAVALADALLELEPMEPVLAHRDLHDKQLLWNRTEGVGVLDLDTAARADPALDLGNLAAHVDLALDQRRWSPEHAGVAHAAIADAAVELDVPGARLAAWRRAARFRVACVHRLRPRWRQRAGVDLERMVGAIERAR